jgi:AraC family transcriptional regulator
MYRVDDECFLVFNEGKEYSSWIDADKAVSSFTFTMSPSFEKQALNALKSGAAGLIEDTSGIEKIRFTERLYIHQPGVSDLIKNMRVLAHDLAANHLRLQELFFSLFLQLTHLQEYSNREAMSTGKVSASSRRELFSRLLRARDFLHSCYNRDITLDHLAEVACLNPYYLLREFRKAFSNTPHQYLTARRISQAMKLLSSGKMDVAEVCLNVGFIDQSSFSKLFRRHTGKSPSEYGRLFGRQ